MHSHASPVTLGTAFMSTATSLLTSNYSPWSSPGDMQRGTEFSYSSPPPPWQGKAGIITRPNHLFVVHVIFMSMSHKGHGKHPHLPIVLPQPGKTTPFFPYLPLKYPPPPICLTPDGSHGAIGVLKSCPA